MSAKPTAALVVVLAFIGLFAARAAAAPALTELVSVRSNGTQGDGISGRVSAPAVSTDGVVVAFDSEATNLVGGDTNGALDVFVRDRASGRTERVSVSSKGKQGDSGSAGPMLSGDGRFVTFSSGAANLVSGDTNGRSDIFVHDRMTGETTRVSVAADGAQGYNNSIGTAAISADGRFVAFTSDASNLVPQTAPGRHIYVKDRSTGAIERVSVDSHGDPAQGFVAASPAISGDGRFVAFASSASNLVNGDTNGMTDVFVHDLLTGATERVSVDSAGGEANGQSVGPGIRGGSAFGARISGDCRLVAFDSIATNLVAGDTNTCGPFFNDIAGECPDVFVHDRMTGETTRVSVDSGGAQANDASTDPDISADGSTIGFFSAASNLVVGDTNTCPVFPNPGHCPDIFVHVG